MAVCVSSERKRDRDEVRERGMKTWISLLGALNNTKRTKRGSVGRFKIPPPPTCLRWIPCVERKENEPRGELKDWHTSMGRLELARILGEEGDMLYVYIAASSDAWVPLRWVCCRGKRMFWERGRDSMN